MADQTNLTANITPERISQGQCVELNKTYDVSSIVGWSTRFQYYGKYDYDFSPENGTYNLLDTISHPMTIDKLRNYFIDPTIFGNKLGMWYQESENYYNTNFEANANLQAFSVNYTCPVEELTQASTTINLTTNNNTIIQQPLAPKRMADILVTRRDALNFTSPQYISNNSRVWIFGVRNSIEDYPTVNNSLILPAAQLQNFDEGLYKVIIITPGPSGIRDVLYDSTTGSITSPFKAVPDLSTNGLSPQVTFSKLEDWLNKYSDSSIKTLNMEIENPYLNIEDIHALNQTDAYGVQFKGLRIEGYTNLQKGDGIYATINEDSLGNAAIQVGGAILDDNNIGDMRQYIVDFPVDISILKQFNFITVHGSYGIAATAPLNTFTAPPGGFIPNQTVRYIGGNFYVPTPTPEVIQLPPVHDTVIVTQTITIPVTPPQSEVDQGMFNAAVSIILKALLVIIAIGLCAWVISAWKRRHDEE